MALRLVFMGTPDFAVPTLVEIVAGGHEVAAVYTRAPQPAGRGLARDRAGRQLQSAPSRGLRRARINRDDLMAAADNFDKRRNGEVGRPHKHQAERQSRLHLLCRLGELLDDEAAFESGQVIDEQHAVDVVDLVLQASRQ